MPIIYALIDFNYYFLSRASEIALIQKGKKVQVN